jgi:uncharacterized repeat protein (TIGR01451 family)
MDADDGPTSPCAAVTPRTQLKLRTHGGVVTMNSKLMLAILAVLAVSLFSSAGWAQTTLNVGDILVMDVTSNGLGGTGTGAVIKVDPTKTANPAGNNQTVVSVGQFFGEPVAITMDSDGQHIVATDHRMNGTGPAAIILIDPTKSNGSNQTVITSGGMLVKPSDNGITIDSLGNIFVVDQGNPSAMPPIPPAIIKCTRTSLTTCTQTMLSQGGLFKTPWGIELEADGNLVVSDGNSAVAPFTGQGGVIRINGLNGSQSPTPPYGPVSWNGLIPCPFGNTVRTSDGTIIVSVFPTNNFGVGCSPPSPGEGAAIIGVSPTNTLAPIVASTQTEISPSPTLGPQCENGGSIFATNCFRVPAGLVIDPTLPANANRLTPVTNAIIVADPSAGKGVCCGDQLILGVDPGTGLQHIVAIDGLFVFPVDVTVVKTASTPPLAPNLSVTKTADVTTVTAGDPATHTYTITVTNTGGSAQNVTLTDTWPTGFNRASVNGCTLTSGTATGTGSFTCSLGNLMMNQSATVTATFTVPSSTPAGPQTNNVSVTSSSPGSNTATASNTITVVTSAPLTVTKDDHVATVTAGDGVTYTYLIVISNSGPSDAQNVTLNDTWPSGFQRTNTTTGCTPMTGFTNFTCSIGTIAAGSSFNVFASYTVPSSTQPGPQTNSVSVTSSTPPNTPGNAATASKTTTVNGPPPSLSITKAGPSTVNTNAPFTYTLTVTNSGQGAANNVQVTDQLPAGVTFVSASGTGWTCTQSGGTVTCTMPSLAANTTAPNITINVTAPSQPGTISNSATVRASNNPSTSSNTVTTTVTQTPPPPSPNLSITKAGPSSVTTGASFTYTLTVTNSGQADAVNVQVTDPLPAGVGFVSASGGGWTCSASGNTVTCTMPTLGANSTAPNITINVIAPSQPGTISNTATVQASNNPPTSSNRVTTTVTQPPAAPAKWTGAGKIRTQNGGFAEFGFDVRQRRDGSVFGQLEFENEKSKLDVESITINTLTVSGQTATFTGTVREKVHGGPSQGPYNFTVTVSDNDPQGRDTFSISIPSDPYQTFESGPVIRGKIEQGTWDGRDDRDDTN